MAKEPVDFLNAVDAYRQDNDIAVIAYYGEVSEQGLDRLFNAPSLRSPVFRGVLLILQTHGGDPHAAYKIMRSLQARYRRVVLAIPGPCKSAGTLMAVGADELLFGPRGELGPIDTQLVKPDELRLSSGLDTIQGLSSVISQVFTSFEAYLLSIMGKSGGAISTKTASEIASELACGLFGPIAAQIDPHRLGEVERAMRIAVEYGKRLLRDNSSVDSLARLVHSYPTHGFVIDLDEAKELFQSVRELTSVETTVVETVASIVGLTGDQPVVVDLEEIIALINQRDDDAESTGQDQRDEAGAEFSGGPSASPSADTDSRPQTEDRPVEELNSTDRACGGNSPNPARGAAENIEDPESAAH